MEMIGLTKEEWYARLFERLGRSKFRSGFHLTQKDIDYIHEKGLDTIRQHARDFIAQREAWSKTAGVSGGCYHDLDREGA